MYHYSLPAELIANEPAHERTHSRLLIYQNKNIREDIFAHIATYLPAPSLLALNKTAVVPCRLAFTHASGERAEVFCLAPENDPQWKLAHRVFHQITLRVLIYKPKKWKNGEARADFEGGRIGAVRLHFHRLPDKDGSQWVMCSWNENCSFMDILQTYARVPLPPYIRRKARAEDLQNYQTVYAEHLQSVAAPTAGLHFSRALLDELKRHKISQTYISLAVSADTFKPMKTHYRDHEMHGEWCTLSRMEIEKIHAQANQIIAVGTTTLRTLESLFLVGCKIFREHLCSNINNNAKDTRRKNDFETFHIAQWEAIQNTTNLDIVQSLSQVLKYMDLHKMECLEIHTQLMITPDYKVRSVRGLITNFHQPDSTLLLIVASLIGEDWRRVYDYAIKNKFRFFSYGDACLFLL